jgi:methylated-DNA-[protein]-cysteine S-methyltransferase
MRTVSYSSPLGQLEIKSLDKYITAIKFIEPGEAGPLISQEHNEVIIQCCKELDEYFEGRRKEFTFPIHQEGTDFQKEVWSQLLTIPYGKTISYSELSKKMGDIKKIRAVGTTNGKNNLAIVVPCHRVIGSNNHLTGYAGGLWRKQWLLEHEARHSHGVQQLKLI